MVPIFLKCANHAGNRIAILLLVLAILLVPSTSIATTTYTFATNYYPPFITEEGGLAIDIVRAALQAVGADAEFVYLPWLRGEQCVEQGECIGTFPYFENKERRAKFAFSEPIIPINTVFFVRTDTHQNWDYSGADSLQGLDAACVHGHFYVADFEKNNVQCHFTRSENNALRMLLQGRVDIVLEPELLGWYELHQIDPISKDLVMTAPTPYRSADSSVIVSKYSDEGLEFLKLFNQGLAIIKADGTYADIYTKHLLPPPSAEASSTQ